MSILVNLSSNETYDNPLSVLLEIVSLEIKQFKLAMLSSNKLDIEHFQVTGFCSEDFCPVYTAEEMLNTSSNLPILQGAFIEDWKKNSHPIRISCADCPDLFQGDLKYFGDAIVIPIWINGGIDRWIVLVDYTLDDISLDLNKLSLLLNYALTNILRTEQKRQLDQARLWIDKELAEISRIQSLLLPQDKLTINGVEIAYKYKAFKEAGGDYFDLFPLPSPDGVIRWGGVIADVTGHGPSAAVEAAMLDAILRTFNGDNETTPATVANYANKHFFSRRDRGKFITAKFFSYRGDTNMLRYVSAGHPNGFIKRNSEVIVLDKSQGIPIGVLQDYQWDYQEIEMLAGDILFIYTDVVLETRNPLKEEFGEDRLKQTLINAPHSPQGLVDSVENALLEFSCTKELMDDLALSAIKLIG